MSHVRQAVYAALAAAHVGVHDAAHVGVRDAAHATVHDVHDVAHATVHDAAHGVAHDVAHGGVHDAAHGGANDARAEPHERDEETSNKVHLPSLEPRYEGPNMGVYVCILFIMCMRAYIVNPVIKHSF